MMEQHEPLHIPTVKEKIGITSQESYAPLPIFVPFPASTKAPSTDSSAQEHDIKTKTTNG